MKGHPVPATAARSRLALAAGLAALACNAHAATTLTSLRYVPDITVTLGGTAVGPNDIANDNLAGGITLALSALPANVNAYHSTGSVHWLVFATTVTLPGGITATPRDVVAWNGTIWSLLMDGATAGIPAGTMIDALASRDGTEILLSLDTTASLPGPVPANPADVLRYSGGAWTTLFDATSAGIPAGANLDGLDVLPNGNLLVSFDSGGSIGPINYAASDILEYGNAGWEISYSGASHNPAWNSANLRDFRAQSSATGTPPFMGNVPDQTATVGTAINAINLATYVTPTDGDAITAYAIGGAVPSWLTVNPATGVISGTPTAAGTFTVSVTATDKDGISNADSIQFTVAAAPPPPPNSPPLMGNVPDQTATVGTAITTINLATYVTPTDGDAITAYALGGAVPPGLTFNTTTGVISGIPTAAGTFTVTVTATDKDGTSNADTIQFTVAAVPPPPPPPPPGPNGVTSVPTLSEWGLMLMSLLLAGFTALNSRSRNNS